MKRYLYVALLAAACNQKEAPPAEAHAPAVTTAAAAPASTPAPGPSSEPPAPAGPPKDLNVILLSIDSLRADMPWAGYPRAIAPRLSELEKQAVSYTRAYSVSSYTSMSLGGMLGDKLPSELKRDGYFFGTYPKDNLFYPEVLHEKGIYTMGVMAHFYFRAAGFEQGFDDWRVVAGIKTDNQTDPNITSPQSEELAEKALGDPANDSRRFFFWAHLLDPHDLYMPHEGISYGKSDRDRYDGEVTFTDRYIAKLLDFVAQKSWGNRTAIIVTSDHGEAFGEHGMTRHGFEIWENLVRVPLFFVLPGAQPRHIDVPRSGLDIAPTILDLFGVEKPDGFEGQSLVKEIYGAPAEARDVLVDLPMTSNNDKRRALVRGHLKLMCLHSDTYCQLFDLDADPKEEHPIMKGDSYQELMTAYKERLTSIHEVTPYACAAGCLNNAYMHKAGQ